MLNKLQELLRKMDEGPFKIVGIFSAGQEYQKLIDFISSLEEKQQKILGQMITLGLIFFPFILCFIINWWNSSLRHELNIYKEIGEQVQYFNFKDNELNSLGRGLLAPTPILGQEDLNTKVKNILNSKSIPAEKISVESYDDLTSTKHLKSIEANLKFNEFTLFDLNLFLNSLIQNEKFKIQEFQFEKNITTSKLVGILRVFHMAKDQGRGQ